MFFVSKRGFFNTKPIFFEEFADEKTKKKDKEKPYKVEEGGKIRVVHQNIDSEKRNNIAHKLHPKIKLSLF